MMKKSLMLIMLSPLLTAESLVSLTSLQQAAMQTLEQVEGSGEPKATYLNFESSNSVDGISFKGVFNPRIVGDKWSYTNGKGLITFIRDSDQKSFTIQADNIGFRPGDDFTNLFIEGHPGPYQIPDPIKIEANKIPMHGSREGLPLIEIKNDVIKITCLWCFARGYSKQKVYKIINTKNEFDYQHLYTLPENAVWDGEDSFTYNHTGGASYGGETTVKKVNDYWYEVKKIEFDCSNYYSGAYYREWEFNEDSETLELIVNDKNCDRLSQ